MQSDAGDASLGLFSLRSIFKFGRDMYEERITLHRAANFNAALDRAAAAARDYANDITTKDVPVEYLSGFGQAYAIADDPAIDGAELFSLIRDSDWEADDYVERYFDTGAERQSEV